MNTWHHDGRNRPDREHNLKHEVEERFYWEIALVQGDPGDPDEHRDYRLAAATSRHLNARALAWVVAVRYDEWAAAANAIQPGEMKKRDTPFVADRLIRDIAGTDWPALTITERGRHAAITIGRAWYPLAHRTIRPISGARELLYYAGDIAVALQLLGHDNSVHRIAAKRSLVQGRFAEGVAVAEMAHAFAARIL